MYSCASNIELDMFALLAMHAHASAGHLHTKREESTDTEVTRELFHARLYLEHSCKNFVLEAIVNIEAISIVMPPSQNLSLNHSQPYRPQSTD